MDESINDALIACVKAAGGSARVGAILFPEKTPTQAQRALLDCLNDDRPAKLSPDQAVKVMELARVRGCHAGMDYLTHRLSYAPTTPIEPEDETDNLRRQVLDMGAQLQDALSRLNKLSERATTRVRRAA